MELQGRGGELTMEEKQILKRRLAKKTCFFVYFILAGVETKRRNYINDSLIWITFVFFGMDVIV